MTASIKLGSRTYLRNAIVGEPGCVCGFTRNGKVQVEWFDMPEIGVTEHSPDTLVVDETFAVRQLHLFEFAEIAA
jgi:hypothetical protein